MTASEPRGRFLLKALRLPAALLAVLAAFGCAFQRKLIFPAGKLEKDFPLTPFMGARETTIRTEDGVDLSALEFRNLKSREIILYFHGNGGALDSWRFEFADLEYLGRDMILFDYRGYGKSGGTVSEKGLYLDAEAVYRHARSLGYAEEDIILYGRSLGTGIAVELAKGKRLSALILESPFSGFRKMIYREYWYMLPYFYLAYTFDSCPKIKRVDSKILILHGTRDEVIPIEYGKELAACSEGRARFTEIEGGGHNDLGRFAAKKTALASFLGSP